MWEENVSEKNWKEILSSDYLKVWAGFAYRSMFCLCSLRTSKVSEYDIYLNYLAQY